MAKGSWLAEIEEFFFRGARAGWAGGNNGSPLQAKDGSPGMEDWKEAIYRDLLVFPGFRCTDRWGIDPDSGRPSGSIFITHWSVPVWGMWVGGNAYDTEVYAFLREVLFKTYRKGAFCGGRGPREFRKGNLLYTNVFEGNFARFSGREQIEYIGENGEKKPAGSHEYWGGSFVFLPRA